MSVNGETHNGYNLHIIYIIKDTITIAPGGNFT